MIIDAHYSHDASPQVLKKRFEDTSRAINGGLEFGGPQQAGPKGNGLKNIQGFWVDVTTPGVADTEFTVDHNLGYIPTGIIVFAVDKATVIYASRKNQWTAKQAFFKANLATVSLQGFVA